MDLQQLKIQKAAVRAYYAASGDAKSRVCLAKLAQLDAQFREEKNAALAQRLVDLAARRQCSFKRFKNPRKLRVIHRVTTVDLVLGKDGWVWFNDTRSGMSGNDPLNEFLGTFRSLIGRKDPLGG